MRAGIAFQALPVCAVLQKMVCLWKQVVQFQAGVIAGGRQVDLGERAERKSHRKGRR